MSKNKNRILKSAIAAVVLVNGWLAYQLATNSQHFSFHSIQQANTSAFASYVTEEEQIHIYTVWEKVDEYPENDYLVEVYREFEVHKDWNGNTVQIVPTDNMDYLKYYQGSRDVYIPTPMEGTE